MRHAVIPAVLLAVSCSSVDDRGACSSSSDCPSGQYCARTSDGNVCWADAVAPLVSSVAVSCSTTPCVRDGVLRVEAAAGDDKELAGVEAALDLDGGTRKVAMTRSGALWAADLPLRDWPFEAFSRPVVASVVARDGARNESGASAAAVEVTRLRWVYDAGVPMSAPAVMEDGTVVVGLSKTTEQILAVRQDGTKAWAVSVGAGFVTAPPTVGTAALWVGSNDSWLRAVALDGSGPLTGAGVGLDGAVRGAVSAAIAQGTEWGFASSMSGRLGASSTTAGEIDKTTATSAYASGTVVTQDGRVCAATSGAASTLRCFDFDGALAQAGAVDVGVNVGAPLAVDSWGNVWTGSQDGKVNKSWLTAGTLETRTIVALSASIVDSPVIARNGDVFVGAEDGSLHRFASDGNAVWPSASRLGTAVLAPMLLADGPCPILVPTRGGTVHALRDDGTEAWRATLASGVELRSGNIFTVGKQTLSSVVSTALFASSDGKLYAVVVDGQLDTSAPWPKAFHDPRNTNNAGTQP